MNRIPTLLAFLIMSSLPAVALEMFPTLMSSFDYPLLGLQARIMGEVELMLSTDSTGEVSNIRLLSGNRLLGDAAIAALRTWRFARQCEKRPAQGSTFRLTVEFKLQGETDARPRSHFMYSYPDKIVVVSDAPRWQP